MTSNFQSPFSINMSESPPFRPIALHSPTINHLSLPSEVKIHEYHHLLKMKKVLAETQQKMENRINLFKKASQKNLKQHEMSCKAFVKIEAVRQKPQILKRIRTRNHPRTESASNQRNLKQHDNTEAGLIAERLIQQKLSNARYLKQEKSRLRIIIQQQRKLEHERKLASANGVRQGRNNAKQAREWLEQQRRENHQRQILQKYARQKDEFLSLEKNLAFLQLQEEQALLSWKRTLQEHP